MSRSTMNRLIEAAFRRLPFVIILIIGSLVIGFAYVNRQAESYEASGTISIATETLVSSQSGISLNADYSYLTPAQFTAQELNGLLATDVFMELTLDRADVTLPDDSAARSTDILAYRMAFNVFPTSSNIIQVNAVTPDPDLSARLAGAAMDQFIDYRFGADTSESSASERFFSGLVDSYEDDLADARNKVDRAVAGIGDNDLSPTQELEIDRLQEEERRAAERYNTALDNLENARLAERQTGTDIEQSYTVLDRPQAPGQPLGRRIDDAMDIAMFGLVGLLAAMIVPLVSALTDQQVHSNDELEARLGVEVVAVVPRFRSSAMDPTRAPASGDESETVLDQSPSRSTQNNGHDDNNLTEEADPDTARVSNHSNDRSKPVNGHHPSSSPTSDRRNARLATRRERSG